MANKRNDKLREKIKKLRNKGRTLREISEQLTKELKKPISTQLVSYYITT